MQRLRWGLSHTAKGQGRTVPHSKGPGENHGHRCPQLYHQPFCSAQQQILHGDLGPTLGLLVTQPKGPSEPPGYSQPMWP